MGTTTNTTDDTATTRADVEPKLRRVLMVNASTSGSGGLVALIFAGTVGELIGTNGTGWVRLIGAGLVAFAVFVLTTARRSTDHLRRETPLISVGDLAWVAGTATTIGLGWYSTRGAVVLAIVAAVVGSFGVAQVALVRRLDQTAGSDD